MTIQEDIVKLEGILHGYQNNLDLAEKSNNKYRATHYQNLIREMKVRINDLENQIPLDQNARLRDIISGLKKQINELGESAKKQDAEMATMRGLIDKLAHPEKHKPKEPSLEDQKVKCTKCGRMVSGGAIGMRTHVSRWCKANT